MSRPTPARALALAAAVAGAATLGGCGKTGELQRPAPLFGHAHAGATTATVKDRRAQDPSRPVTTIDPRDAVLDPGPSRSVPIEGQSPDPIGPGPRGALPDPYANPQR